MSKRWILLVVCLLMVMSSAGAILQARGAIADENRGWEQASRTADLPLRTPIAGVNVELTQYAPDELDAQLDDISTLPFVWIRQTFLWETIQPSADNFDWSVYDPIVEAVATHPSLQLVAVLDGTPTWARHADAPAHPFAPPASVQQYADFVRAFASRYGETIDFYQIWDEPNIRTHWGNLDPRPATYVAMLQQAYKAIHEEDHGAQVILAALAPNVETGPANLSDLLFLQHVYDLGGGESFDAAAAKPYGFDSAYDDRTVDAGTLNFSRIILLREEMVRRGDSTKPMWGSNFGWNHLPDDWTGPPSIWGQTSAHDQQVWTANAWLRAEIEWPWLNGLILQHWQPDAPADDPIQGFAIAPHLDAWQSVLNRPKTANALPAGRYAANTPLVTYAGYWQFSDIGADALSTVPDGIDINQVENTITVPFYGTEFGLEVRRDNYLAYLSITIDGEPANALPINKQGQAYLVLTAPRREPTVETILVAEGLPIGEHIAIITHRPALGDDRWPIVGFGVGSQPDTTTQERTQMAGILVGLLAIALAGWTTIKLPWRSIQAPSRESLKDVGQWTLTLVASTLFIVGVVLTWDGMVTNFLRRDPPAILLAVASVSVAYLAPTVWLSALGLIAFMVIIFNRPVMGFMAIIFWSIFFTTNLDLHFRLIAVLEVMLALSVVAIVARQLTLWGAEVKAAQAERTRMHWGTLTRMDVALLAFGGLASVSLVWVELLPEAFRELRTMILGPLVFYALLRIAGLKKREWLLLVDILIVGGTTIAVIGLWNYVTGDYVVTTAEGSRRLIGVYGSPNSVALHLGRSIPFALTYIIFDKGWRRVLGGLASTIMLVALLLTQSVGAIILGIPAAIAVILIGWRGRRALVPMSGLAVAGLVALIPLAQLVPRLKNLTDFQNSTTLFRVNLWRSTFELLQDRPITGVGLDQFLYAYRSRYILPEAWADPDLSHPHNVILNFWVRLGILGVVMAMALQVIFWRTAWQAYRQVRHTDALKLALVLGAMGCMADFLAHGLVDTAYFAINLSYIFMFCMALVGWLARDEETVA